MKKIIALILSACMILGLLAGCSKQTEQAAETSERTSQVTTALSTDFEKTDDEMFTDRDSDFSYDASTAVKIELNGDSAASDGSVTIAGSTVTITQEGTYIVSGTLNDGQIVVDADSSQKIQIVLSDAHITSSSSAALYVKQADKVFVTLEGENELTSGDSFVQTDDNNVDAAVFSKDDLTFNGEGSLTVTSPSGHGIVSKDDLVITGGTYNITAANQGISANDSVRIKVASVTVNAGKDAIHAENADDAELGFVYISSGTFKLTAEGDGIDASAFVQINDGNFTVIAGGGYENASVKTSDNWGKFGGGKMQGGPMGDMQQSTAEDDESTSMKGVKGNSGVLISGGNLSINSADDSVHSNVSVVINGGELNIKSGDDAVHADETLTVTGGTIDVVASYEGLEAQKLEIQGGNIKIVASDDGLNASGGTDQSGMGGRDGMFGGPNGAQSANGTIVISGGKLYISAGGDGIDSNGSIEITGGNVSVCGPTNGDTSVLDYDTTGTITGGTFIGTGAISMAQSLTSNEQGVIAVNAGKASAGDKITLTDSNGNVIIETTPELAYQLVILSSPDIVSGETYTLTVGTSSSQVSAD